MFRRSKLHSVHLCTTIQPFLVCCSARTGCMSAWHVAARSPDTISTCLHHKQYEQWLRKLPFVSALTLLRQFLQVKASLPVP